MAKYIAHVKTWLGHENRMVDPGEEFETTFPEGMKLSGNIELIQQKTKHTGTRKTVKKTEAETDQGDGDTDTSDTETPDTEAETDQGDGDTDTSDTEPPDTEGSEA